MKKTGKLLLTIILLLCLIALSLFVIIRQHDLKTAEEEAERAAEAAEQKQAEEEAEEQARLEKIDEEKAQWYLMLVNEWNGIPDDFDVTTTEIEDGYVVDERIKDALAEMLSDCREAGHSPRIISSFRTYETQKYLYDHTANKADTAIPGHSEHECGLAIDIIDSASLSWADPLIDKQEEMPAQMWLMEHCDEYGFILRYPKGMQEQTGIIYEPWHYRYVGKEHAAIIMDSGICLEEYIENMAEYYDPE